MARAAATADSALRGVFFLQPLAVEVAGLLVECIMAGGRFDMRSGVEYALADAAVHCSGTVGAIDGWHRVEHASMRSSVCVRAADVHTLYDGFDAAGLQYGPGYRTLVQAWGGGVEAAARLRQRVAWHALQVHPADLDDALCTTGVIASGGAHGETRLPFAVDDALLQGATGMLWAVRGSCRHRSGHADAEPLCIPLPAGSRTAECQGGLCAAWWRR